MAIILPHLFDVKFENRKVGAMTDISAEEQGWGLGYTKDDMRDQTIIPHFKHLESKNAGLQLIVSHMNDLGQIRWMSWDVIKNILDVYAVTYVEERKRQEERQKNPPKYSKPSNLVKLSSF